MNFYKVTYTVYFSLHYKEILVSELYIQMKEEQTQATCTACACHLKGQTVIKCQKAEQPESSSERQVVVAY